MRNLKIQSQLKVRNLYRHWAILRCEDLVFAPDAVLNELAQRFHLTRAPTLTATKAPSKAEMRGASAFSTEDRAFVIGSLDHSQEHLLGYDYGQALADEDSTADATEPHRAHEHALQTTPATAQKPSLILMAGQSNMVGNYAKLEDLPPHLATPKDTEIWMRRPKTFAPLEAGSGYQKRGVGPEIGFADEWQSLQQGPLRLVKSARDGASVLTQLATNPPGGLFRRLLLDTQRTMGVLGVAPTALIWMQGEFEARTDDASAEYAERFHALLHALRSTLGAPIPFVICGRMSGDGTKYPFNDWINSVFEGASDQGVRLFDTADLTRQDQVHYDTDSVVEAGRRAARCLFAARATHP